MALRRRDRVGRFGSSGQYLQGASQKRERIVDHWLEHSCTSTLHGRDVEAGVQPRVSTGRSIHAVPSITPSPREGIEHGPRLPSAESPRAQAGAWPKPAATGSAGVTVPGRPRKPPTGLPEAQRSQRRAIPDQYKNGGLAQWLTNPIPIRITRATRASGGKAPTVALGSCRRAFTSCRDRNDVRHGDRHGDVAGIIRP